LTVYVLYTRTTFTLRVLHVSTAILKPSMFYRRTDKKSKNAPRELLRKSVHPYNGIPIYEVSSRLLKMARCFARGKDVKKICETNFIYFSRRSPTSSRTSRRRREFCIYDFTAVQPSNVILFIDNKKNRFICFSSCMLLFSKIPVRYEILVL